MGDCKYGESNEETERLRETENQGEKKEIEIPSTPSYLQGVLEEFQLYGGGGGGTSRGFSINLVMKCSYIY